MGANVVLLGLLGLLLTARAHPTMYKLNDNDKLEPDLVPISSTVIPLPIYQVSYGIDVAGGAKGLKEHKTVIDRPQGPVTLVTVHSKKPLPIEKAKAGTPLAKEVPKQELGDRDH